MKMILHCMSFMALIGCMTFATAGESLGNPAVSIPSALQNKTSEARRVKVQAGIAKMRADAQLKKIQDDAEQSTLAEQAFTNVTQGLFPMNPSQIRTIRRLYNQTNRAIAFTGDTPPRPTSSSLLVNLSPGSTPPVIRLSRGYVSSLVFLDSTGAPWPIQAYDVGDPAAFNIQWKANSKSSHNMGNTMLIQANTMYRQGNLAIILEGLNTPVMVTLIPGQKAIDYRVDVQLPMLGPNAKPQLNSLPSVSDDGLLSVLNHIAPPNSKRLEVSGGNAEAWMRDSRLYFRTPLTVVSPSWVSKMSSSDHMVHAYVLPPTSVILALYNGKMVTLKVKGI